MSNPLIGIDLGGTKIEGIILDGPGHREVLARKRIPTEKTKGYDHIIGNIVGLVRQLASEHHINLKSVGIGTPGVLDPATQTMKNCNTTVLNGRNVKADLEKALTVPVFMANDANCFAVAETVLGIVPDHVPQARITFGVIMGTGVGGGLVVNGQVWNGVHGIGGEWGHNFLDASGGPCYCGRSGCVETVIAGPSLERFYKAQSGQARSLKEILERRESDKYAEQTIQRLLHFFGKAIGPLVNVIDPDAIILGGGVGNIDELYTEGRKYVLPFLFNNRFDTPILKPKLGDSAGVFGAALLNLTDTN
ncbi:MAG: ROK family protein [Bacteroidota bacterium]